jgi:hypothetical protein
MPPFAGREVRSVTASAIDFEMRNLRSIRRSPHSKSSTPIRASRSIWSSHRSPTGDSCSRSESAPHPSWGGSPLPGTKGNAVCASDDRQKIGMAKSDEEGNGGDAQTRRNCHNERIIARWGRAMATKRSAWDGTAVEDRVGAQRSEGTTLRGGAGTIEISWRRERTAAR